MTIADALPRTIKEEVTNVDQTENIAALVSLLTRYDLSLSLVLTNDIFSSSAPAALGPLSVEEVLEYLDEILLKTGLPLDLTTKAREELATINSPVEGLPAEETAKLEPRPDPLEGVTEIEPTMKPAPGEADLSVDGQAIPGRLDSLRSHLSSITGQRTTSTDPQLRQRFLEESAYDAARLQVQSELANMNKTLDSTLSMQKDDMKALVWKWTMGLTEKIEEKLANPAPYRPKQGIVQEWDFIALVPSEKAAYLAIAELLKASQNTTNAVHDGVTIATACVNIGRSLEREYQAQEMQKRDSEKFKRHMDLAKMGMLGPGGPTAELSRMWKKELERVEKEERDDDGLKSWSQVIRVRIGASLIAAVIDTATIERKVVMQEVDENGEMRDVTQSVLLYLSVLLRLTIEQHRSSTCFLPFISIRQRNEAWCSQAQSSTRRTP